VIHSIYFLFYSTVTKARDPKTGAIVAIKKLKMDPELERNAGMPHIVIREIRALRDLQHPNIVKLIEIVTSVPSDRNRGRGETFMVFECCDHDLSGIAVTRDFDMSPTRLRSYMYQILSGLAHMHAKGWVHRDLKPTNILVTSGNLIKIADFGLSRNIGIGKKSFSTYQVVTQWYRAPELIFADPSSGCAVDIWAAGCILAELMTGQPLFTSDDNLQHIREIYRLCGSPDPQTWPGLKSFKNWVLYGPRSHFVPQFRQKFKKWVFTLTVSVLEYAYYFYNLVLYTFLYISKQLATSSTRFTNAIANFIT
jgi:serine/threonine protein kinase